MVLETIVHAIGVVAFIQAKLRIRKTVDAQPRFFESSSKLLQTFVAPKNQTKERILERTKVKIERKKEDCLGHNSGGTGRQ